MKTLLVWDIPRRKKRVSVIKIPRFLWGLTCWLELHMYSSCFTWEEWACGQYSIRCIASISATIISQKENKSLLKSATHHKSPAWSEALSHIYSSCLSCRFSAGSRTSVWWTTRLLLSSAAISRLSPLWRRSCRRWRRVWPSTGSSTTRCWR